MSTHVDPFTSLSSVVDGRLLRSLAAQGFTHPTPIQAAVIPAAVSDNRDVLARAKTGSGKTLAYGIPCIQKIINARSRLAAGFTDENYMRTRAMVLVPTRELAEQVTTHIKTLCQFMNDNDAIRVVNVAGSGTGAGSNGKGKGSADKVHRMLLADKPDVVVATPSRALIHLRSKALDISHLECLIIDEADLILSYGHSSDDISSILTGGGGGLWTLPSVYQSLLMSATLTDEVDVLKNLVLRNPITIKLSDAASSSSHSPSNLTQYVVKTSEDDKFLLLYVILKLKLIKGKILIFVNDTDRSYRLKLFLEKFGIRSGVLNAELPFNSRYHAVQEFNRGVFNYLIATDESGLEGVERDSEDEAEDEEAQTALISTQAEEAHVDADAAIDGEEEAGPSTSSKKRKATPALPSKKSKKAKSHSANLASEYGVTRGIDFIEVACVINFDLPTSARSYTHRIGRTARAGRSGISLSFVVPKNKWGPENQPGKGKFETSLKSAKKDEKIWRRIEKDQKASAGGSEGKVDLKEYKFDMNQVEGFRYRMEDALRAVTRAYVREARIKELKQEVLNSDKLKAHFEDNPRDLAFLRHDKPLHPSRVQSHMKHVPSYLMPRIAPVGGASAQNTESSSSNAEAGASSSGSGSKGTGTKSGYVPFRKNGKDANGKGKGKFKGGPKKSGAGKRGDPLKSFKRK